MKGDKSIPFWIYLIVGLVMILVSWLVDRNVEENKMSFFILAGIIFMIVGAAKGIHYKLAVESRQRSPPHKKVVHHAPHHDGRTAHAHHATHQRQHANPQHAQHRGQMTQQTPRHTVHKPKHDFPPVRCHRCNAKLHPRFRFCPGCGAKVR